MSRLDRLRPWSRWLPATIPLALIGLIASQQTTAHAQALPTANVFGTYTNGGGLYNYNLSVQNTGLTTLLFVDITVPLSPSLTNLSAPAGFQTVFDSGLGLVTFLPNNPLSNGEFTPGRTVSGFLFSLPTLLTAPGFVATDENLNEARGTVRLTAVSAPEPGTLGLFALVGMPFAAAAVSRRRRHAVSAQS